MPFSSACSSQIIPTTQLPSEDLGNILTMFTYCSVESTKLSECVVGFMNASDTCTHGDDLWLRCSTGQYNSVVVVVVHQFITPINTTSSSM